MGTSVLGKDKKTDRWAISMPTIDLKIKGT